MPHNSSPSAGPPYDPEVPFQLGGILFLASIFYLNFASRVMLAPLLPSIEAELGISHAQAGSLFFFISTGYCFSLFASGYMASRLGHRITVGIASLCTSAALVLVAGSQGLWSLRTGVLLLGGAAGLYLPSGIASVASLSPPAHWGRAMAIHELAPNLALVSAPLLAEVLFIWTSWRGVVLFMGLLCLLAGVMFLWRGKGGGFKGEVPNFAAMKKVAGSAKVWSVALMLTLGIGASLGVYSLLTVYLVEVHQFERTGANLLLGLSRLAGVALVFASGWLSDKLGPRFMILASLSFMGIFTAGLGLGTGWVLTALVFLQYSATVCLFPAAFAALSQASEAKNRNLAVAVSTGAAALAGGGAIPAGLGLAAQEGHFQLGYILLGILMLLGALYIKRFGNSTKGS